MSAQSEVLEGLRQEKQQFQRALEDRMETVRMNERLEVQLLKFFFRRS